MKAKDKLKVKFEIIERAEVALMKAPNYKWLSHLDAIVKKGDEYTVLAPFSFYIISYSTSIFKGTVKFKTWVEKGD